MSCDYGTYMDLESHDLGICKTCRRCGPHEETVQACNTTHDTKCGPCSHGTYYGSRYKIWGVGKVWVFLWMTCIGLNQNSILYEKLHVQSQM